MERTTSDCRAAEDVEKYKTMVKTLLFNGVDELHRKAYKYNQWVTLCKVNIGASVPRCFIHDDARYKYSIIIIIIKSRYPKKKTMEDS